jgi:acyl-CoA synthetase (AMP-forming)/AMP-acid ligase II
MAINLVRAGIGPGDFVALILGRCLEAVETALAITRAGAVGVPLDPRSPPSELSNILHHCSARAVIADIRHLSQLRDAIRAEEAAGPMFILVSSSTTPIVDEEPESRTVLYESWAQGGECTTAGVSIDEDTGAEPSFLHYTSGTTSSPKGVLSSQHSWLWSAQSFVHAFGLTEEDQFFWPLPLFHCIGHALCIIATLTVGASVYFPDPNDILVDSLRTEQGRKATVIVGAPATYHEIVTTASKSTCSPILPRLRACMVGGSSATAALSSQVEELFGVPLLNNYGCSETCGAIAVGKPGGPYREDGIPAPVPGMELKLMDHDGNEVQEGEQGEVWIRSAGLMIGYYKEAESPFTSEGWFPTGDIARRSNDTNGLTFVGRKKELIIRGGENIQPDEVEKVLLQLPGVADVVVAGISHHFLGETPAAFIVRERSTTHKSEAVDIGPSKLLAACRQSLPEYKIPTGQISMVFSYIPHLISRCC